MGDRRVSGWFIMSAVFLVLVFGLFFTFTERKTWPEHRVELGPMDMRMVPPVSTWWCEAVALHSDHSFVAYQVSHNTKSNPVRMSLQRVHQQVRLGGSWNTNTVKLKYFLLPASVIEVFACASFPDAKLLVFKGDLDVQKCLQSIVYKEYSRSSDYDSDEESSEEEEDDDEYSTVPFDGAVFPQKNVCSSLMAQQSIDVSFMDGYSTDCSLLTRLHPMKVNVTSADEYVIVIWNANRHGLNHVSLQILLDRTRYVVHRSGQPFDICSLSNSCTIGLGFASGDRVLVSIPEEPNSGRSSFIVRSRCKPRLAIFAILSVFLPLLLFLVVAFVVRSDRDAFMAKFCCKKPERRQPNRPTFLPSLLDDQNAESFESIPIPDSPRFEQLEEMPPPYHTLYDSPPPYSCVDGDKEKTTQSR